MPLPAPLALGVFLGAAILRIAVDAPGLYEVPPGAVKDAGLDLAACDLYGVGAAAESGATETAVPIVARPDGGFRFLAAVRTRHAKETAFVLRPRPAAGAAASAATRAADEAHLPVPEGYFRHERNEVYDPLESEDRGALADYGYGAGCAYDWFYFAAPAASAEAKLEFPKGALAPGGAKDATIPVAICMQGDRRAAASNGVDLLWNGKPLGKTVRWAGPKPFVARLDLDQKLLKQGAPNVLRLDARDGHIRLDWVELGLAAADPAGPARKPRSVEKREPEDLRTGGADWVAITVDACAEAVKPLAAHRESQGLKARVVRLRDVFDGFSAGNFDPRAIRRFLEHAAKAWSPAPRFVLLCGDATFDVDLAPRKGGDGDVLPAALVDVFDPGAAATDNWYVAFDADRTVPSIAIGRFPVSSAAAAKSLVDRTIAYETRAPYGPWRRKLSFVAGEGRFGEVIDRAIEDLALTIFNDYVPQSYELNMTYASAASPYLYVPQKLTEKVIERMNEGAAIVSYTGHGHQSGFDSLHFRGKRYPIFRSEDVSRVKCGERRPIVFITACLTGYFDHPAEESVGELLFEHPAGPAAVFAATRISHPFPNAVLSKELVASLFGASAPTAPTGTAVPAAPAPRRERLGEVIVEAKRLMMEAKDPYRDMIATYGLMFLGDPILLIRLLKDDCQLYNLLGDPALRLPFPRGTVTLTAAGPAIAGKPLTVKGTTDSLKDGKAIVTFEIQRKQIRGELEPVEFERAGAEKRIEKNYEMANRKVVVEVEAKIEGGAFEATLALPDDLLFTKHYVKAYAWNDSGDAAGALELITTGEE